MGAIEAVKSGFAQRKDVVIHRVGMGIRRTIAARERTFSEGRREGVADASCLQFICSIGAMTSLTVSDAMNEWWK